MSEVSDIAPGAAAAPFEQSRNNASNELQGKNHSYRLDGWN